MSPDPSGRKMPIPEPTGECGSRVVEDPNRLTKRHVSFGCELEFLVACIWEPARDPDEDLDLAPVFVFAEDCRRDTAFAMVKASIAKCLTDAGLPVSDMQRLSEDVSGQDDKRNVWPPPDDEHTHDEPRHEEVLDDEPLDDRPLDDKPLHDEPAPDEPLPDEPLPDEPEQDASAQDVHASMDKSYAAGFTITSDGSVSEPCKYGYEWVPIEMTTPAAWNKPVYFDMVRLAVNLLTTKYRIRINSSAGFHVHVGVGAGKRIDTRTLRRFGALWWAASPLLYTLHSPERRNKNYSFSLRDYDISLVSGSTTDYKGVADHAWESWYDHIYGGDEGLARARVFTRDWFAGEAYDVEDDPAVQAYLNEGPNFSAERWVNWQKKRLLPTGLNQLIPILGLPGRVAEDLEHMRGGKDARRSDFEEPTLVYMPDASLMAPEELRIAQHSAGDQAPPRPGAAPAMRDIDHIPPRPHAQHDRLSDYVARGFPECQPSRCGQAHAVRKDVMSGVSQILSCPLGALVAGVLHNQSSNKEQGLNWVEYLAHSLDHALKTKLTLEVRMASASMDADWVVAWAGICTRLLEFSRDADEAEWLRVIRILAWAQEEMMEEEEDDEEDDEGVDEEDGGDWEMKEAEKKVKKKVKTEAERKDEAKKVKYDVLDLLVDIGAFEHVSAAENRLREVGPAPEGEVLRGWCECPTVEACAPRLYNGFSEQWNHRPEDSFVQIDCPEARHAVDMEEGRAGQEGGAGPSEAPEVVIDLPPDAPEVVPATATATASAPAPAPESASRPPIDLSEDAAEEPTQEVFELEA